MAGENIEASPSSLWRPEARMALPPHALLLEDPELSLGRGTVLGRRPGLPNLTGIAKEGQSRATQRDRHHRMHPRSRRLADLPCPESDTCLGQLRGTSTTASPFGQWPRWRSVPNILAVEV